MAVFDATALVHLLEPGAPAAENPATGQPVPNASARIKHLVNTLEERREKVVIPTPALSEVLVHANEAADDYLKVLHKSARFRIAPFDERAAVEHAAMTREAIGRGDLRAGSDATRGRSQVRPADHRNRPCRRGIRDLLRRCEPRQVWLRPRVESHADL